MQVVRTCMCNGVISQSSTTRQGDVEVSTFPQRFSKSDMYALGTDSQMGVNFFLYLVYVKKSGDLFHQVSQ
jgi:hypothetical protein